MIIKVTKIDKNFFNINVTNENYLIIKNLIEKERNKIISKLKNYKAAGFINSIFRPRNKAMQKELDELALKKKVLKNSINQINKIFR